MEDHSLEKSVNLKIKVMSRSKWLGCLLPV